MYLSTKIYTVYTVLLYSTVQYHRQYNTCTFSCTVHRGATQYCSTKIPWENCVGKLQEFRELQKIAIFWPSVANF